MNVYVETNDHRTFHSADGNSTEVEVNSFVLGLLAVIQPRLVVETGAYQGAMTNTLLIGSSAEVYTCDTDLAKIIALQDRKHFRLHAKQMTGVELIHSLPNDSIDLAFLDSSGGRLGEVQALINGQKLAKNGVILIHDSKRNDPVSRDRDAVRFLKNIGRNVIELPTARGLALSL